MAETINQISSVLLAISGLIGSAVLLIVVGSLFSSLLNNLTNKKK